jgi:1-acyl-sn-glycerol-3-phosphate acyltransferase
MTHKPTARELAFLAAYYGGSGAQALAALPLLARGDRRALRRLVASNARYVRSLMTRVADIELEVEALERLPAGPFILAAKHGSWGDGYAWLSVLPQLTVVAGAHVLQPSIVRRIAEGAGHVVVDREGSLGARGRALHLTTEALRARGEPVLIFPEGRIAWPGEHVPFERGVAYLAEALGWPVFPAASSLGARWPNDDALVLRPGPATMRVLPALPRGLARKALMRALFEAVTEETDALLRRDGGVTPSLKPVRSEA